MTERFVIGLVGSPFGLNGFVKVRSCSGEINHLLKLESVIAGKDGKECLLKIEESAPSPPSIALMRFEGIDSPEKAKTLNGAQLFAERERAAPLKEGEYYIEDLKGLAVFAEDGEIIGHIADILEGGGGELAEVSLTTGKVKLVPFRNDFFPEINPINGRVILKNTWILE